MASSEDNAALLELLRREVKKDPVQTTVVDMTKLGLVEITRKKIKKTLYEMMQGTA
jgi:ribonuclease G